jgi:hypothetical protein
MTNQEIINKYTEIDEINRNKLSRYEDLPIHFLREFQDKVDWNEISMREDLDEDFIREFQDRVNWYYVSDSIWEDLSPEFRKKFEHRLVRK